MILTLLFTALATVTTSGDITLTAGEIWAVTTVLTNAGSSILSMFMQFWQPIVILAVIIGIISFILWRLKSNG